MTDDKVSYHFRFIDLAEETRNLMQLDFESMKIMCGSGKMKDSDNYTLMLAIPENIDDEIISNTISDYQLKEHQYGIWISFKSYYDMGGLTLPGYVGNLYRKIGGSLDYSYIIILDAP